MMEVLISDLCADIGWILSRAQQKAINLDGRNRDLLIRDLQNAYDDANKIKKQILWEKKNEQ
tara:strand:- start:37 stop:222 length:186 start_codon:yes stop_codon:yes gene_type:complete